MLEMMGRRMGSIYIHIISTEIYDYIGISIVWVDAFDKFVNQVLDI